MMKGVFIMAEVKNAIKVIKESIGHINPKYDISYQNVDDIYNNHKHDKIGLIIDGFRFGYIQGMKAVKAEIRKGGAVNV